LLWQQLLLPLLTILYLRLLPPFGLSMQAQLHKIKMTKVMVELVEQAQQQVVDEEEGRGRYVVCQDGSMLRREAVLWVEPTTV
jgi:hypothetical protein